MQKCKPKCSETNVGFYCTIAHTSVIYQETSLSMSFICSCIKAFLVLTTTKNKNVEIIQCLQFTFCTDTWWRQFNICTVTCAVFVLSLGSHISWKKQFSVVKTAIKREYRRFNYFAVLGPIYAHLVSFAPYHDLLSETDTGRKQSLFKCYCIFITF